MQFGTGPFLDVDWDARRAKYEQVIRTRITSLDPAVTTPVNGNPRRRRLHRRAMARRAIGRRDRRAQSLCITPSGHPAVLMATGHNAASAVADDLNLTRRQSWWTARRAASRST